jgi:hypothetical protein
LSAAFLVAQKSGGQNKKVEIKKQQGLKAPATQFFIF